MKPKLLACPDGFFDFLGPRYAAVEKIAGRAFQQPAEKYLLKIYPFRSIEQQMRIIEGPAFSGADALFCTDRFSRFEQAESVLCAYWLDGRRERIVAEEEDPAERCAFSMRGRPTDPVRIEHSVGFFGGFVAEGRSSIKTAVFFSQASGILAILLAGEDILAFADVEERGKLDEKWIKAVREAITGLEKFVKNVQETGEYQ